MTVHPRRAGEPIEVGPDAARVLNEVMTTPECAASTVARMRKTAADLEVTEAALHHSAEASPDLRTRDRLHRLGDQVTAESRDIVSRAEGLSAERG